MSVHLIWIGKITQDAELEFDLKEILQCKKNQQAKKWKEISSKKLFCDKM